MRKNIKNNLYTSLGIFLIIFGIQKTFFSLGGIINPLDFLIGFNIELSKYLSILNGVFLFICGTLIALRKKYIFNIFPAGSFFLIFLPNGWNVISYGKLVLLQFLDSKIDTQVIVLLVSQIIYIFLFGMLLLHFSFPKTREEF